MLVLLAHLTYIGHSMGTTSILQLLTEKPEYSKYLKPIILMAPVTHVYHIRSPVLLLGAYTPALIKFFESVSFIYINYQF